MSAKSTYQSIVEKTAGIKNGETTRTGLKRMHDRRAKDPCVSVIDGKTYPVENWSRGGILVFGDPHAFSFDSELDVTLRFKLRGETVIDLPHKARVVRKTFDRVALEFLPLTQAVKKGFQTVIDDFMTAEFAESQLV